MTSPKRAYKRTSLHNLTYGFLNLPHPSWITIFGARNHHFIGGQSWSEICFLKGVGLRRDEDLSFSQLVIFIHMLHS